MLDVRVLALLGPDVMSELSSRSAVKRPSLKTSQRRGASRKVKSGVLQQHAADFVDWTVR